VRVERSVVIKVSS